MSSEIDRVAAASREEEVLKIFKMLDPRPKELLLSPRRYIKGGAIQTYNVVQRKRKPRVLFLFNDVLLIAKREGKAKYWLKTYIRLRGELKLEDVQTKLVPNVEFRLVAPKKTFFFFAENEAKKLEWLREIQACINGEYDLDRVQVIEKSTHTTTTIEIERQVQAPAPTPAPVPEPNTIYVQVPAPAPEPQVIVMPAPEPQVVREVVTEVKEVYQFGPSVDVGNVEDFLDDDELLDDLEAVKL